MTFFQRIYIPILRLILRIFFRLLYHEMAWTYGWVSAAVSAGHWNEWVQQALPFVQGKRILELGFGPGNLLVELARSGKEVFGVDRSNQMARRFQAQKTSGRNSRLNGYAQSVNILQGDGTCLPFPTDCFDSVIATFPTEYIFLPATAAEIERILVPGGRFILIATAWITGKSLHERAASLLFQVAGQSEPEQTGWQTPFDALSMSVQIRWIDLAHSRVCVLVVEKASRTATGAGA